MKDAIRCKMPRKHGHSLTVIIASINRTTGGWFEYFKHTSYWNVFRDLDGWIRRRLRRIVLKRHKRHRHNGLGPEILIRKACKMTALYASKRTDGLGIAEVFDIASVTPLKSSVIHSYTPLAVECYANILFHRL